MESRGVLSSGSEPWLPIRTIWELLVSELIGLSVLH